MLLILAVLILVGNTLIAVAFLRGRKNNLKILAEEPMTRHLDELHRRVQELSRKPK